jgi:hypothetical protein
VQLIVPEGAEDEYGVVDGVLAERLLHFQAPLNVNQALLDEVLTVLPLRAHDCEIDHQQSHGIWVFAVLLYQFLLCPMQGLLSLRYFFCGTALLLLYILLNALLTL